MAGDDVQKSAVFPNPLLHTRDGPRSNAPPRYFRGRKEYHNSRHRTELFSLEYFYITLHVSRKTPIVPHRFQGKPHHAKLWSSLRLSWHYPLSFVFESICALEAPRLPKRSAKKPANDSVQLSMNTRCPNSKRCRQCERGAEVSPAPCSRAIVTLSPSTLVT